MSVIEFSGVGKQYHQRGNKALTTTLKGYLLRDMWRRKTRNRATSQPWALRDIDLAIARGRAVGVIGRNGSGKSTLLKLMSRILGPDTGRVAVNGKVAALIELGAGFHPELTGRENILVNGVILGLTRREVKARMDAIVAFADIGAAIDWPVRTYSSGMYARLGFAVAIHVNPDILLVDELLSVGDAAFTRKCREALTKFKAEDKSIVVVSHDLSTVVDFCDEALWLDCGVVRMRGPAAAVVDAYRADVA